MPCTRLDCSLVIRSLVIRSHHFPRFICIWLYSRRQLDDVSSGSVEPAWHCTTVRSCDHDIPQAACGRRRPIRHDDQPQNLQVPVLMHVGSRSRCTSTIVLVHTVPVAFSSCQWTVIPVLWYRLTPSAATWGHTLILSIAHPCPRVRSFSACQPVFSYCPTQRFYLSTPSCPCLVAIFACQ
jgi:hypothetical protein